ncbi:hypothetical protein [Modestobacter sp. Leaf380]|uniref:hypothetical protein n=1 Tax=Modestobacter sp. Leaf380 TaxID=1736356 RepID=UPI0006F7685A|nr:hypothetical protein [Modestobacter sp. Leaf380]KQS68280.1 hypothetical protein ASG41_04535 [Modestobacter sp. Leaf380]
MGLPEQWGVSAAEVAGTYGCDELRPDAPLRWLRGVDVTAPPATAFRWLCQLRAAPYSYDLVDNLGRRSPRTLSPGLDELAVGQRVATVFRLHGFVPGRELTLVLPPGPAARASGDMVVSYLALPGDREGTSRLLAVLRVQALPRPVATALCWGDLVMMRRQLQNLAGLAAG